MLRLGLLLAVVVAACGGNNSLRPGADGPPMPDAGSGSATPDGPATACGEIAAAPATAIPAHLTGAIAQSSILAPATCTVVDAPFGIVSQGPEAVVRLDGLTVGAKYAIKLTSAADLAFYVITGCDAPAGTGPTAAECALYVDATNAGEQGVFTATAATEDVVVDYWQTTPPADPTFTLDVYADECDATTACTAATCVDHQCVSCGSSFDCTDAAAACCDPDTHACTSGSDQCTGDDATAEPGDDGPAGATVLVPGTPITAHVCASPRSEADFYAFDVTTIGEQWTIQLGWTSGSRDLDLYLFDDTGMPLGFSLWERPEHVAVGYLPPGRYYARVTEFASGTPATSAVAYTISATRTTGAGCHDAADCATGYRNQIFRGDCQAGSCIPLDGDGATPEGGRCDSASDCADDLYCPSFFFVANADTREVCARSCTNDNQCDAGDVCTTYASPNFCVAKCTDDAQCATAPAEQPEDGPWVQLSCQQSTGRCLP